MLVLLLVLPLLVAAPAQPAESQTDRLKSSRGQHVAVIDEDRREWQGKLREVEADKLVIDIDSATRAFELTKVRRVDADGDRVIDGAIKGAIFGGLTGLLVSGGRSQALVVGGATWGLVGIAIDALTRCRHTVYRSPARATP